MSLNTPSGSLAPWQEVVPEPARLAGVSRASAIQGRRYARVAPQGPQTYGSPSAGTGGGSQQINFVLSDGQGFLDLRSVKFHYWVSTAVAGTVVDDGHVFSTVQINLGGQTITNLTNAAKVCNAEVAMGSSKNYYQTAGSFEQLELLNGDLNTSTTSYKWGGVSANLADIATRLQVVGRPTTNNKYGSPRTIPLSSICGFGRMKYLLPIQFLGQLSFILQTGAATEMTFNGTTAVNSGGTSTSDFALDNVYMSYEICVPSDDYADIVKSLVRESEQGLLLPYEDQTCPSGGVIGSGTAGPAGTTTLSEYTIIASRPTSNLLRATLLQIPPSALQNSGWPSQSCFSHAGVWSLYFAIGSEKFPSITPQGDAELFAMSLSAFGSGSVSQDNATIVNRQLWGQSTALTANSTTPVMWESPNVGYSAGLSTITTAATVYSAFGDRFCPSYGWQQWKNCAGPSIQGVNLSQSSGSQIQCVVVSAPPIAYQPYLVLTALKFIEVKKGVAGVVGA